MDDHNRFNELYETHRRAVHAYLARRMDRSRVDDAVADTFAVAWRRIDTVPKGDSALPWLYGVAYRVAGHQWRSIGRLSRLRTKIGSVTTLTEVDSAELVVQSQEYEQVVEALGRLSALDQEVLRLSVWEELRQADIAEALSISISAVKQRARRARSRLEAEYRSIAEDASQTGASS